MTASPDVLPRTVPRRIPQGRIGSSLGFFGFQSLKHEISPGFIPGHTALQTLFFGAWRRILANYPANSFEFIAHATHEIRELAVQLLGFAAEPFGCPGPLTLQHRPKAQPLEQCFCHHADSPTAEVVTFFVLGARLSHLHEPRFLEQGNGPFASALAYARVLHDGAHVYVDEAAGWRRDAQTHGSEVEVAQDRFQHDLAGFTAF